MDKFVKGVFLFSGGFALGAITVVKVIAKSNELISVIKKLLLMKFYECPVKISTFFIAMNQTIKTRKKIGMLKSL